MAVKKTSAEKAFAQSEVRRLHNKAIKSTCKTYARQFVEAVHAKDQALAEAKNLTKVGLNDFVEAGYVSASQLVKVLGNGSLTTKLDVEANAFSKSAVAAIEAVGGNAVKL